MFVTMKRDMMLAKTALENAVKQHKESVKKARAVESEIEVSFYCRHGLLKSLLA